MQSWAMHMTSTHSDVAEAGLGAESGKDHGVVVTYSPTDPVQGQSHDSVTRAAIGKMLAALKGYRFAG